jgi:hypothetical protein
MNKENRKMAYIAGIFDGDGSFSIGKLKTKANPIYFPLLQFVNCKKEIIDFLRSQLGGNVVTCKPIIKKDGSLGNIVYRWRIRSSRNVLLVLNALIPFLRIKKDRAELLLEFINKFPFIPGIKQQRERIVDKESYYLKMIHLNDWTSLDNTVTTLLSKDNTENDIFWSYIAGLIDTDGSLSIKKQMQNKGTHVINPRYVPVISISMTDTRALNYLRQNCNLGKLYIPKNKSCSNGFHYQYGIYSKKDCSIFLKKIIPFLVGKKNNAKVLLNFCENSENTKYCKAGISKKELLFRENCYQELIELNKNGVVKSPLMDLEPAAGNAGGNKAQAAKACSVNAVSEETLKGDTVL